MMRFDFFKKRNEEPVKVLELFGGIGACTQAFICAVGKREERDRKEA